MDSDIERECVVSEPVEADLIAGSDYRGAYRVGGRIALELEEATGKVLVTRGHGSVRLAYLVGPQAETIASCLRVGYRYSGRIVDIALGLRGKVLHLQLEPPTR